MTTEEKAKAYDEALERAKDCLTDRKFSETEDTIRSVMEYIFPELAESEDEVTRKWILDYLCDGLRKSDKQFKDQFKSAIAWLEKQKEQKPAEKQDYSGLNDLERAIHRGFLAAGIENVPVTIIKETAKECLAQMKPAKWGENDENMLNSIINVVCGVGIQSNGGLREKQVSWLKSIPESFNLQPKQEWSEEDKQDFDDLIMRFEKSLRINRCYFTSYDVDWLKSKLNGNSGK